MVTPAPKPDGQPSAKPAQVQRPARALLGWMAHEQALLIQNGFRAGEAVPEHVKRAEIARNAVAARSVGLDQTDLISEVSSELNAHISTVQAHLPDPAPGVAVRGPETE